MGAKAPDFACAALTRTMEATFGTSRSTRTVTRRVEREVRRLRPHALAPQSFAQTPCRTRRFKRRPHRGRTFPRKRALPSSHERPLHALWVRSSEGVAHGGEGSRLRLRGPYTRYGGDVWNVALYTRNATHRVEREVWRLRPHTLAPQSFTQAPCRTRRFKRRLHRGRKALHICTFAHLHIREATHLRSEAKRHTPVFPILSPPKKLSPSRLAPNSPFPNHPKTRKWALKCPSRAFRRTKPPHSAKKTYLCSKVARKTPRTATHKDNLLYK